ncbi:MAG: hypothetical protein ACOYOH_04815 [Paracraurococcus sp.]
MANFRRTLALPEAVRHWSLTTLRDRLVRLGAKIVRHGRSIACQMAEAMVPPALFLHSSDAIAALRPEAPRRCWAEPGSELTRAQRAGEGRSHGPRKSIPGPAAAFCGGRRPAGGAVLHSSHGSVSRAALLCGALRSGRLHRAANRGKSG